MTDAKTRSCSCGLPSKDSTSTTARTRSTGATPAQSSLAVYNGDPWNSIDGGSLWPEPHSDGMDPGLQPVYRTFEHSEASQDKKLSARILPLARLVKVQEMHRRPQK